ncbi:protein kinase family protein [Lacunimicrobium album]
MSALVLPRRRLDLRPDDLVWDNGRLMIKQSFSELFDGHSLTSFSSLMNQPELASAKAARKDRLTYRFELSSPAGVRVFYLKWHGRAPWKDYVKPWLQGKTAIVGAWNEWQAMHHFEAAGVASMKPVAYGEHHAESFVIIEGLEGYTKLSDLLKKHPVSAFQTSAVYELIDTLAAQTAKMHAANLHHQDYYLGHLLVENCFERCLIDGVTWTTAPTLRVIDLGRALRQRSMIRRWIVKDLAQLDYSARECPAEWRERFWTTYCHSLNYSDTNGLLKAIQSKSSRIATHSRKHKI